MRYINAPVIVFVASLMLFGKVFAEKNEPTGSLLFSECQWESSPELVRWCNKVGAELGHWYYKILDDLQVKRSEMKQLKLSLVDACSGVCYCDGTICVSRQWVSEHSDDTGMLIYFLVLTVFADSGQPDWVKNGAADYYRWTVYEKKDLEWQVNHSRVALFEKSYVESSRTAAAFILWIETHKVSGFVRQLMDSLVNRNYSDSLFEEVTGERLESLWREYFMYVQQTKQPAILGWIGSLFSLFGLEQCFSVCCRPVAK